MLCCLNLKKHLSNGCQIHVCVRFFSCINLWSVLSTGMWSIKFLSAFSSVRRWKFHWGNEIFFKLWKLSRLMGFFGVGSSAYHFHQVNGRLFRSHQGCFGVHLNLTFGHLNYFQHINKCVEKPHTQKFNLSTEFFSRTFGFINFFSEVFKFIIIQIHVSFFFSKKNANVSILVFFTLFFLLKFLQTISMFQSCAVFVKTTDLSTCSSSQWRRIFLEFSIRKFPSIINQNIQDSVFFCHLRVFFFARKIVLLNRDW